MLVGCRHAVIAEDQQATLTPRRFACEPQYTGNAGGAQRAAFEPLEDRKRLVLNHFESAGRRIAFLGALLRKSETVRLGRTRCARKRPIPSLFLTRVCLVKSNAGNLE